MMPLNHIFRKCTARYKLRKSQENINHFMYSDGHQTFGRKRKKKVETLIQTVRNQSRYRDGIWHWKMHLARKEKWQTTHKRRSRTTKSSSLQNARRKGNLQILGDIENWHHQTNEMKEKMKEEYLRKSRKLLETKLYARNPVKRINNLGCPSRKILGTLLEVD